MYVWRIFRIRTGPAEVVATVRAPSAKSALRVAAREVETETCL
jgi:hypothetical protein